MTNSHQPLVAAWQSALQRGLQHLRAGEFDDAEECFARAYRLEPDRPEVCYALGRARLRRGDAQQAETLLRLAWDRDRSLISAAGNLARCLGMHQRRFAEAHAVLDDATSVHGELALLDVVRSELFLEQDHLDPARTCAEAALAKIADRTESMSESRKADRAVRRAASAALARVYNREALALAGAGESEQALFLFKRVADLDPNWSSPHVNMGALFASMGNRSRARQCYEYAVAVDPASSVAHFNLGVLLRQLGDLNGARSALEQALECDPAAADAVLALASVHLEAGAGDEAIELLAGALEAEPENADLWAQLGIALAHAGESDGADASWCHALNLDPYHPEACLRLADLRTRQSRFCEAAILAQRAQSRIRPDARRGSESERSEPV